MNSIFFFIFETQLLLTGQFPIKLVTFFFFKTESGSVIKKEACNFFKLNRDHGRDKFEELMKPFFKDTCNIYDNLDCLFNKMKYAFRSKKLRHRYFFFMKFSLFCHKFVTRYHRMSREKR